jgi:glucosamine--fructose-6-phosphate aminotransferase (isomerizing)
LIEKTFLYQEIHQQPDVLARLLRKEDENIRRLAAAIQERNITHIVIAARGTSDNAARYAKYLFGAVNGLTVALATPSLFSIYQQPPKFKDALVLGISQSGKSPDIVSVLQEARRQGALTATITNVPESALGQATDHVIDLHAGQEISIAATKTYTSELTAIAMLCVRLKGDSQMSSDLAKIPDNIAKTISMDTQIRQIVSRYRYMNSCVVIGRGYNYATAFEFALKLKELTYTIVEPYSSADFLHGPVAMIETGFPVIVISPNGVLIPEMFEFISILKKRDAEVIAISDVSEILSISRIPLQLPVTVPEWLSPIVCIVPGQQFSMHLAHERDFDVDHPRALRKVTETH